MLIYNDYINYKFRVYSVKQIVTQYQITNWDGNGHMNNIQTILTVLEDLNKVQCKMGNTPIVVHCR